MGDDLLLKLVRNSIFGHTHLPFYCEAKVILRLFEGNPQHAV